MDFRRRLAQLDSPPDPGGRKAELPDIEADGSAGTQPRGEDRMAQSAGVPGDSAAERQTTLDTLRRKMAELLSRKPPAAPPPTDPTLAELPFLLEQADEGPLCASRNRLTPSHHVGRMPVDAAADASAEMLALLALDPSLAGCDPARALYFDTETTGLGGGAGVLAFLVGMAFFDPDGRLVVEQLLLRAPGEERPLLRAVADRFEHASVLVSFNGKAFDLPMLTGRMVMNRLPPLPPRPHLDLLHLARRLHAPRLGTCRLTNLESEVLGFVRGEDIDGSEVPQRYWHFLRTGDEQALRAVVDHNGWDVISMAALVGLYGEPLGALHAEDLTALARTLKRAKALAQAQEAAEMALEQGAGHAALRIRGDIAKARGDRMGALADYQAISREVDDASVRLELAKLYEHHVREPLRALQLVERGTGETAEATQRRRVRLERKLAKQTQRE